MLSMDPFELLKANYTTMTPENMQLYRLIVVGIDVQQINEIKFDRMVLTQGIVAILLVVRIDIGKTKTNCC